MNTPTAEMQSFHRRVRDLVACTASPAFWAGREPRAIVESFADVLLRTLGLDLVYVCVKGPSDDVVLEAARAEGQTNGADQAQVVGRALAPWLQAANSHPPPSIPHPAGGGTVRLAVVPLRDEGEYGVVAAGSQRADFPTEADHLLLDMGANQVATWLREARLLTALREAEQLKDTVLAREQAARAELDEWKNRYEAAIQATGQLLYDRNAQMQLASIVESSGDAILSQSLDGIILSWNTGAERLYGYTAAEIMGQPVSRLAPPEQLEEMPSILERLRQGERIEYAETVRQKKDGTRVIVSLTMSPVKNATGQIIGVSTIAHDITARKQAEEAIRRSEQELADFFENATVGLHWVGPDGTILRVNRAELELLGYTREEYLGHHIAEFHADQEVIEDILQRLTQGETLANYEARLRSKDGSLRHVLIDSSVMWEQGRFVHTRCFTRDITARKQLERQLVQRATELERLNAELQQFSYVASHDLQEPLRMITSYVQLLARRYGATLDAEAQEFMAFVVEGAQRMQQLITDLLAYTRVNGTVREFTAVDCEALLARVLRDLQEAIKESAAEITHASLPTVPGNAGLLGLVFQNLLGNALKFRGAAPPRIHVSAWRERAQWVFAVRDNGIGIDPQHAERIFQVFQRLHTRQAYPGTGIGLAICKKIVERHGGRIWVESKPQEGATFYFTISDERND